MGRPTRPPLSGRIHSGGEKPVFSESKQLRVPGPTPIPPRVTRAAGRPMINHRGTDFRELFERVNERTKKVFKTTGDLIFLTASGTGGMEAACANLLSPGDRVLVPVMGAFSERFAKIAEAYGAVVERIPVEWGKPVEPEAIRERLSRTSFKAVFTTHNETSTGVENDIEVISRVVHEYGPLLVVDAISSLGAVNLETDNWGIDMVITGSQKALMVPPGMSILSVSKRAWDAIAASKSPRFYFDLERARASAEKWETPYTPAVSILFALDESLAMIEEEGLEAIFARHKLVSSMVRAGVRALGLELLAADAWASKTVTAVLGPSGISPDELRKVANSKYGVVLSGGQGELSGKIFRIGHLGYISPMDIIGVIAALELSLRDLGYPVKLGAGVGACEEAWKA